MKKSFAAAFVMVLVSLTSCATAKGIFGRDYTVPVTESLETVQSRAETKISDGSYLRKFSTVDKMNRHHEVIFLDEQYISIDGEIYAFKFNNLMYYGLALNLGSDRTVTLDGTDKVLGIQGYATSVKNPELTIGFIFARKLFAQPGYSSMYEATKIGGVSFYAPNVDDGYVDDFGKWRRYTYFDYFDNIFKTTKQDVRTEMYQAIQLERS